MTTPFRTALAAAVLLTCSAAALAVPYALPSGPDIAQAKLSGPLPGTYAVVFDDRTGVPCDVEPGTYQLQTFDQTWRVSKRNVVVSADDGTGNGATRTLVNESCVRDDEDDEPQRCVATCPSGTQATGGVSGPSGPVLCGAGHSDFFRGAAGVSDIATAGHGSRA